MIMEFETVLVMKWVSDIKNEISYWIIALITSKKSSRETILQTSNHYAYKGELHTGGGSNI